MKTPEHFTIKELVDPDTYQKFGKKSWKFLDSRALETLDQLRNMFGPAIVNTWAYPNLHKPYGIRKHSGFRPPGCGVGVAYSQHRFGRAFDVLFKNHNASEVRIKVLNSSRKLFPHITRIEGMVHWFHFDVGFIPNHNGIYVFNP